MRSSTASQREETHVHDQCRSLTLHNRPHYIPIVERSHCFLLVLLGTQESERLQLDLQKGVEKIFRRLVVRESLRGGRRRGKVEMVALGGRARLHELGDLGLDLLDPILPPVPLLLKLCFSFGRFLVHDSLRVKRFEIVEQLDGPSQLRPQPVSYTHLTLPTNREV